MDEEQVNTSKLLDTTDCLEAIGVFRWWKNFLFIIVLLCLLLLQGSFWLVDLGYVETEATKANTLVVGLGKEQAAQEAITTGDTEQVTSAAKQVTTGPNQPAEAESEKPQESKPVKVIFLPGVKFKQIAVLVRFLNFVLIPAAVLYCLTMLFSLKVSMLGRLGGISHIARAMFLSLAFVAFLLPWQRLFGGIFSGVMYTPEELLNRFSVICGGECKIWCVVLYYLRFTGYWLLVVILLFFAQLRSARWVRTVLRRLEVI